MLNYLRIAVTVLSLIACVMLIALWVRSYVWGDHFIGPLSGTRWLGFSSSLGFHKGHLQFPYWPIVVLTVAFIGGFSSGQFDIFVSSAMAIPEPNTLLQAQAGIMAVSFLVSARRRSRFAARIG